MVFTGTKRYRPIRLIGTGGMGEVYEVEDRLTGDRVALKLVFGVGGNALVRFKREFRALCDLHHDNLIQLFELSSEADQWFFTMEFVEGIDFISYVCPKPAWQDDLSFDSEDAGTEPTMPSGQVGRPFYGYDELRLVDSLGQLVRGLMVLHDAGLVHRDVKPGNVLVTKAGRVVLLDFGLVKAIDQDELSMDTVGDMAGTIPYMAPELAAGGDVSPAVDWYSLGVLLYQALTGRLPFEGPPLEVLVRKQSEQVASPQSLNPECHPALASCAQKLLDPDPDKRVDGPTLLRVLDGIARPASRRSSGPLLSLSLSEVFVGRQAELARISSEWGRAIAEDLRIVLLEGESGIGKSRLMDHFLESVLAGEQARKGYVFRGRCYERESMAYKAFDAVVDRLSLKLSRMPDEELAFLLPENIWYLVSLFPALNRIRLINDARYPRMKDGDPAVARRRAFNAFGTLIVRLSMQHPVVLGIDDLQWADHDSMELLDAAVAAWTEGPMRKGRILILASMRPRVAPDFVLETLDRMERRALASRIELGPLDQQESEHLVTYLLSNAAMSTGLEPQPQLVETIAEEAGGNPFLLGEMAQFLQQRADEGESLRGEIIDMAEVVARRIEELPPESRDILAHVAVAGEPLSQELLADSMGTSPRTSQWRRSLAMLRSARLVRYQGFKGRDIIETYHDRTRKAVIDLLSPETLQSIHEDLARAMERAGGVDPEGLARHWLAAKDFSRAKEYLARAADQAIQKLAFGRAVQLLSSAVDMETDEELRCQLRMKLGQALVNDGRPAEAIDAFTRAAASSDDSLRLKALIHAASNRFKAGYISQGLSSLQDVLDELGLKMPAPGLWTLISVGGKRLRMKLRGTEFDVRSRQDLSERELIRLEVLWTLASSLSLVDPVVAAGFHSRLLLDSLDMGQPDYIAVALAIEAGTRASFGASQVTEARRMLVKAESLIAESKDIRIKGRLVMAKGFISYFTGEWERCIEQTEEALDLFRNRSYGMGWEIAASVSFQGWALMLQGKMKELSDLVHRELRRARRTGDRLLSANLTTSMGIVWLASDDIDGAARLIDDAVLTWPKNRFQIQHYYVLYAKTELMLYQGKVQDAWKWVTKEHPKLKRALLDRVGIVRQEMARLEGRVALAMAARATSPGERRGFLKTVATQVRRLRKEGYSFTDAWAEHLEAGRLWIETKDAPKAAARFSRAINALEAARVGLHALAARRSRAIIVGDKDETRRVDELFRRQGVVNPAGITAVLSPGVLQE